MEIKHFYELLFDASEATCFAEHAKGTKVSLINEKIATAHRFAFFSINPLHPHKDLASVEPYHNPDRPRRCDANVTAYRNFLIEIDSLPLEDQERYVSDLRLPYSTKVYSGGKSYHFIISLEQPLSDRKEYDSFALKILKIVGKADKTVKNPSRLSRCPGHFREDKGREQQLLEVRSRSPKIVIEDWFTLHNIPLVDKTEVVRQVIPINLNAISANNLSGFTKNFLMFGAEEGERNISLFRAACNCRELGFNFDQTVEVLAPALANLGEFSEMEFYRTIRSAFSR